MKNKKTFYSILIYMLIAVLSSDNVLAIAPKSVFQIDKKGRVIVPLTDREREQITPSFSSVQDFWTHDDAWRKTHQNTRLRWFIRHGESTSNVLDFTQYPGIYTPLTWRGRQQARRMAKYLESVPFDRYFASHLERAYRTVRELAKRQNRIARLSIDERLQEIIFWPAGGMSFLESKLFFKELEQVYHTRPEQFSVPGAKSFAEFRTDIRIMLDQLAEIEDKNIALGTHGMTILFSIMEAFRIPLKKLWAVRKTLLTPANVSITILGYNPDITEWELLVYADQSYLPAALTKASSKTSVSIEHYLVAIARLLFAPLPIHRSELADYFPSQATFKKPSPHHIQELLNTPSLLEMSV